MKKFIAKLKDISNKDVTSFLNKYKIPLVSIVILILLACIGLIVSYAYYQVVASNPVISGAAGKIPDLDVRIMAEDRDESGDGIGTYVLYDYIPQAGYQYNSTKSYCTNGSTINYDSTTYDADIVALGHDVCYLYFDSTAQLDITLYVYAEDINDSGEGAGTYTLLNTTSMPSAGYEVNKYECKNGGTVAYDADSNMFTVDATQKEVCSVWMDAYDVDISLKTYVESSVGSGYYVEVDTIPENHTFTLNTDDSKSTCTDGGSISYTNGKIIISSTTKTRCTAYLTMVS